MMMAKKLVCDDDNVDVSDVNDGDNDDVAANFMLVMVKVKLTVGKIVMVTMMMFVILVKVKLTVGKQTDEKVRKGGGGHSMSPRYKI